MRKSGSGGRVGRLNPRDGHGIEGSCKSSSNPGMVNPKSNDKSNGGSASPSVGHGMLGKRKSISKPGISNPKSNDRSSGGKLSPSDGHGIVGRINEQLEANENAWSRGWCSGRSRQNRCSWASAT